MKTPLTKKEIIQAVTEEISTGSIMLLNETETNISVYDNNEGKEICFTFAEFINEDWLSKKIYVNPKLKHKFGKKVSEQEISKLLLSALPKEYFTILNKIFIVYQISDIKKIAQHLYDSKQSELCFDYSEFWLNQCGLMLWEHDCVFWP